MKNIWKWIKENPNRTMFLIPILLVAAISISHVVTWYDIANPLNWAIYLSIAIEVGAMTALVAATNRIKGGVWFMFGMVTLIQMIGNIFYSYKEIDATGDLFKSWVELTGPFWDMFTDSTDVISMKRWLAFLEGGLLPIISLTSLHFFVKYEKPEEKEGVEHKVWEKVKELKKEGKLPPDPTPEELEDEPTALAFTTYEVDTIEDGKDIEDIRKMYPANVEGSKEFNEVNEIEETNGDNIIAEPIIENGPLFSKKEEIENDTLEDNEVSEYFDKYPIPVIEEENTEIIQSEKDAEVFVNSIEDPTPPNEILQNALKKYKQSQNNGKTNIKRID